MNELLGAAFMMATEIIGRLLATKLNYLDALIEDDDSMHFKS